jgi:WHEP-TRS domain-containing protein
MSEAATTATPEQLAAVTAQGDVVRSLKESGASKDEIGEAIKKLMGKFLSSDPLLVSTLF